MANLIRSKNEKAKRGFIMKKKNSILTPEVVNLLNAATFWLEESEKPVYAHKLEDYFLSFHYMRIHIPEIDDSEVKFIFTDDKISAEYIEFDENDAPTRTGEVEIYRNLLGEEEEVRKFVKNLAKVIGIPISKNKTHIDFLSQVFGSDFTWENPLLDGNGNTLYRSADPDENFGYPMYKVIFNDAEKTCIALYDSLHGYQPTGHIDLTDTNCVNLMRQKLAELLESHANLIAGMANRMFR